MASEVVYLSALEGERRKAYEQARQEKGRFFAYTDDDGRARKVRWTPGSSNSGVMSGLEDVGVQRPAHWYDAPLEGGIGVRLEDGDTSH